MMAAIEIGENLAGVIQGLIIMSAFVAFLWILLRN
jgi:hypothetical protein